MTTSTARSFSRPEPPMCSGLKRLLLRSIDDSPVAEHSADHNEGSRKQHVGFVDPSS